MSKKKHAGGRPPKYTKVDVMQEKIDKYFESCFGPARNRNGELIRTPEGEIVMKQIRPFTITGLALALDMDRRSLLNYSEKEEFFPTIKRAKLRIENYLEERLIEDSSTGIIFNLKNNYGWKDKQENINVGISYEDYIKRVEDEEEY